MVGEERERVLLEISRLEHGCLNHRHAEATALKFAEQGCFGKRSFVRNAWEPGSVSSTCEVHAHTHPTWWALKVTSVGGHRIQGCSNLDCLITQCGRGQGNEDCFSVFKTTGFFLH